jgi:cysteine desulfurase
MDAVTPEIPVYLDYQASTPLDRAVLEAMCEWFERCGNPHSTEHAFGWAARRAVETARASVADVVNAEPDDVVFTAGATEANNLALFGAAARGPAARDTFIVSAVEHASVVEPIRALAGRGYQVITLPVDSEGRVSLPALDAALSSRVLLVSVGAINNEIGTIQDIEGIGARCRDAGALFHTDAAQALTGRSLPLADLPVDFASLSSHKAYGPAGIGALYIAPGRARCIAPQMLGGEQQRGLRSGTLPTPLCVGFGRACALIAANGQAERDRVAELRDEFWERLKAAVPELQLNGPTDRAMRHPGNLHVTAPGIDARDLIQRLQPLVACSSGSACHSGHEGPSPVLIALGFSGSRARAAWRMSLGRQSTLDDVVRATDRIVAALRSSADSRTD